MAKIDQQSGGLRPGKQSALNTDEQHKLLTFSELEVTQVLEAKMP